MGDGMKEIQAQKEPFRKEMKAPESCAPFFRGF
jgi:hypothetical protein